MSAGRLALLKRLGAVAAVLLLLAHVVIFALVVRHSAADWRQRLLRGKACLLFIEVAPEERCLADMLYYDVRVLRERAESLDRLGYLRPPLVKDTRVRAPLAGEGCADGSLQILSAGRDAVITHGTARLPRRGGEPADAVLLAYGPSPEEQTAFALVGVGAAGARADASWRRTLPAGALPASPDIGVTAWAIDAEEGKAYRLCGNDAAGLPD